MKRFLVYGLTNGWGGVQAIIMSMVKNMSEHFKFDIIVSEGICIYEDKYSSKNVSFFHIPAWGANRSGFNHALINLLEQNTYDYVWVNGCIMSNKDIISVVKKHSVAKIITHSHGSSFEANNIIKKIILLVLHYKNRNFYLKNVDFPCMCSVKSGVWYYGKDYLKKKHVHYIKNGIEYDKFKFNQEIRKEYRKNLNIKDEVAIFHAGRLTYVKNQKRILQIFADYLSLGIKARLFIAGEGELKNELLNLSKELNIQDKVVFLGNRNDVSSLYQAMDVMLLPSFHEGFPVTLTEAQSSGLPCLVSDRVSQETNINGSVKYLSIEGEDNQEWISSLKNLANQNTSARTELGYKVYEEGYDIDIVCEDFLRYLGIS